MPKQNQIKEEPVQIQARYKYHCHGCTNTTGYFEKPVLNAIVKCPHCGMEQLTKLENFVKEA